jgi:hypothetical protein
MDSKEVCITAPTVMDTSSLPWLGKWRDARDIAGARLAVHRKLREGVDRCARQIRGQEAKEGCCARGGDTLAGAVV